VINLKKCTMYFGLTIGLFFSACDSNSQTNREIEEPKRDIVGQFIDSAVEGVEYRCGNIIDVTDKNGTFFCTELPVSFHIGDILLGKVTIIPSDKQVFPQDLVDVNRSEVNNTQVIKLALLLQSLDNDNNATNGIQITDTIKELFDEEIIISEVTIDELKARIHSKDINLIFKDIEEVINHLSFSVGIRNDSENIETNDNDNNPEINTTIDSNDNNDNNDNNSEINTTIDSNDNNNSEINTIVVDTTAPNRPTLTITPKFTNQESVMIQVNGEENALLFVNSILSGTLNSSGVLNFSLNTSGEDGEKDFNLTLKDSSSNESSILNIKIIKDTTPPVQNSTIDSLTTDDTTPALSGDLPSGNDDSNTTNYIVKIKIDNENYTVTNDKDGTWSLANDTIDSLNMGIHDVNISVTDEANNTSSTFLAGKIEIDNTGFLIDSAIEGIKYVSGAYSGYTDKDGLFKYDKGAGVTFYVGNESTGISLGTATEKIDPYNSNRRIITLFDLAGTQDENNPRVINMGKFLQSLDSDNDVSNGITIDKRTKESIALLGLNNRIDFDMDIESFHNHNDIYELFNDLAGHFGEHRGLVDTADTKAHLVSIRDNTLATKSYAVAKVSGEKKVIKIFNGVFQSVGGVVEGLEYRSGNQFGRTDASGAFKYEEGKKVKFYIYQLELGITEGKAVVTPADLVPSTSFNHPKPRNIIRLLNAFDAHASANILIDNAVREALEKYRSQIDINLPDGKANAELNIPQGKDEFGAQFEDFEMGKDILDEIDSIRGEA